MTRRRFDALTITSPLLLAMALPFSPAMAQQGNAQDPSNDARVQALQQRVDMLEQRLNDVLRAAQAAAPPGSPAARPVQAASPQPPTTVAQRPPASRPGSFDVDEDAAQRALERTLTQQGALLLPQGAMSVTPSLGYSRVERDNRVLTDIVNPATGATGVVVDTQTLRRNEFNARVEFRAGLPMESQLEISVPFQHVRSSRRDTFSDPSDANGSGMGDLTIGVAKTLVREKGRMPDVIGRLSFNTGTGKRSDGPVVLNGGYRQLTGEVVALKRQDPLAFFAGASYGHVFEEDGIKPGPVTTLSIGTVLAASPATSLQFGFSQTHRGKQEVNGVRVPGSDETYGMLNVGASSVLSRDVMLIVSAGIGVGSDAPKYSLNVALPITF